MTTPTDQTDVIDIPGAVAEVLDRARGATSGRAARTLIPGAGAPLKQTLLALTAGTVLADHEAPGSATLHVLEGDVRLLAGDQVIELPTGALAAIPPLRHSVESVEDAVILISVATSGGEDSTDT